MRKNAWSVNKQLAQAQKYHPGFLSFILIDFMINFSA